MSSHRADSPATVVTWTTSQQLAHVITNARDHPVVDALGGWRALEVALGLEPNAVARGVQSASVAARAAHFGRNYVAPPPSKSLVHLMIQAAFVDRTNLMLLGAGVVSLLLGVLAGTHPQTDWVEGTCVLIAVAAIVLVTALTELKKERQFQELNAVKNNPLVHVVRDGGTPLEAPMRELVVGDVVVLHTGDVVPADGVLLSSQELRVDESAMTGEAEPVSKNWDSEKRNVVLGGTTVMEGSGSMLVLCVGEHTQEGLILSVVHGKTKPITANTVLNPENKNHDLESYTGLATPTNQHHGAQEPTQMEPEKDEEEAEALDRTPLALKLEQLNLAMGKIGIVVSTLLFIVLSIKFSIEEFAVDGKPWSAGALSKFVNFFILAVTTLVVAIPEGLPLAVILALTYSVRRMLTEKALVRHLYACETAGNATIICSDKTGTLTTNEMTVTTMYVGEPHAEITAATQLTETIGGKSAMVDLILQSMAINSSAELLEKASTGSPTESALLRFVQCAGGDYVALRESVVVVRVLPFSSDRKCMTTVVKKNQDTSVLVLTKGAPESVLQRCTRSAWRAGSGGDEGSDADVAPITPLVASDKNEILATVVDKYASRGCRTLCLAYKRIASSTDGTVEIHDAASVENDLVLLAIVAIEDPIRPEVPHAIALCKSAGVSVCMVTGDNLATASSIARQCGILPPSSLSSGGDLEQGCTTKLAVAMDASEFRARVTDSRTGSLLQPEFDAVWPSLRVLARATPLDKYILVTGLMATKVPDDNNNDNSNSNSRQLVAVTGDGTNDAAALKKAHVGFAMGRGGTEVAKRASDIVILDDNFLSIVNAIKWGRNVYDSIAKFLQFQLTMICVAVVMATGSALLMETPALTAVQILWVNLFMDAFVSLGLATETPTDNVMKRKPYSLEAPLLSRKMRRHIAGQVVFQLLVLVTRAGADWPLATQEDRGRVDKTDPSIKSTMVFNTFAWLQLFNQINCRRIDDELNVFAGLVRNTLFVGGWILQALFQFVAIQYGGTLFHAVALDGDQWAVCVGIAALSLPWGFVLRYIGSR